MTELEGNFDVIIFGTGLVESITAAALSKAGVKVAHLDYNPYYGGDEASLTLDELARWADSRSTSLQGPETLPHYLAAQRAKFTSVSRSPVIPDHARHYSISLAPSLIISVGPLISSLIASGVSRYGGYRLLERVGIYSNANGLQNVPGSKEDVFKSSLNLIEKRRLMRFLVFASGEFENSNELQGHAQTAFPDFLKSKFSLTPDMVDAIVYALAFCTSATDATLHALTRLRSYLRSAGRYGASPFLVGHYGGLGEIAQGFCRVSAVHGGVYILDRRSEAASSGDKFVVQLHDFPDPLTADVLIAAQDQLPVSLQPSPVHDIPLSSIARCIVVIDKPIPFPPMLSSQEGLGEGEAESSSATSGGEGAGGQKSESETPSEEPVEPTPIDTSVIIFPPNSVNDASSTEAAQALVTGVGTLSAPQGKYVVYLSIPIANGEDPERLIESYLNTILSLANVSEPLFKLVYVQHVASPLSSTPGVVNQPSICVSPPLQSHLTEIADSASSAAESLFFRVIDLLKAKNPQMWTTESTGEAGVGGDIFSELKVPMWPPSEGPREDENGDD